LKVGGHNLPNISLIEDVFSVLVSLEVHNDPAPYGPCPCGISGRNLHRSGVFGHDNFGHQQEIDICPKTGARTDRLHRQWLPKDPAQLPS
jgi:hypothetical protein